MLRATNFFYSRVCLFCRRFSLVIIYLLFISINILAQNGWTKISTIPTLRAAASAEVVNGKIYVIGGTSGTPNFTNLAVNEVYDPVTNKWESKKSMPTPRGLLTTAVLNDTIYAIGGGYPTNTNKVEAYDPLTDTWSARKDMPFANMEMQAGVVSGKIYVIGGAFGKLNCLEYNPITNGWIEKTPMPEPGGVVSVTVYNNLIYTFGGTLSPTGPINSTVWAYNPETDSWTKKKNMPTARFDLQTYLVDGKIYAIGGSQGQGTSLSTVEVYNPYTDSWEIKPDMPFKSLWFARAVANNKIYVISGTPDWATGDGSVWEYDPEFNTPVAAGNVSGIWILGNSPYHINGEITIPNDSTLTIEPGVEIVFMGHYKLNVQGRLLAVGTKKDSIRFAAEDKQNGWHGVRFDQTLNVNDTSKLIYCSFKYGNANTGSTYDRCGGAIFINQFDKVLISNCLFELNMNSGNVNTTGGAAIGIATASPLIINSTFCNNKGTNDGAIINAYNSNSIISNNIFSKNESVWGTIIYYGGGSPILYGNKISNNLATDGGGGICIQNGSAPRIENNIITNNQVLNNTSWGGGILCDDANPIIINNIITYNGVAMGGGVSFYQNCKPTLINNTIVNNFAKYGGGIYCDVSSDPILVNNIIHSNTASVGGDQVYINDFNSDPYFFFNDVQGGKIAFGGSGAGSNYFGYYQNNIDFDPLFRDTTYNLSDSSQCIGAGIDSIEINGTMYHCPAFCKMGNPRPSPAGSNPDIGPCENPLPFPKITDVKQESTIPKEFALYQNYPNPFNPNTTIKYSLPISSFVTLKVYDILGNEIITLVNERKSAGNYSVNFNASNLPSGIYFYRMQAGGFASTKKFVLLK